jgi:hypothetical protein
LKPRQYLSAPRAGNTARMECSLRRLASGPSASAIHLNQTASREYRCDGDFDGAVSLPFNSTRRQMAINRGKTCSSSHGKPDNHSSLSPWSKSRPDHSQKTSRSKIGQSLGKSFEPEHSKFRSVSIVPSIDSGWKNPLYRPRFRMHSRISAQNQQDISLNLL